MVRRTSICFAFCFVLAACSDAAGGGDFGASGGAGGTTASGEGASSGSAGTDGTVDPGTGGFGNVLDAGTSGSPGPASNCAAATEFIYVIDRDNRLFRFDPTVASPSAFSLVGPMGCQGGDGPNSMSVGRDGFAYVLYGMQGVFGGYTCLGVKKVDIQTGACAGDTPIQCGASGFNKFGMGFATDTAGSSSDSLYLCNSESPALGRVDMMTGGVSNLGTLPGAAEFTGNSMGELWGFFPDTNPPSVLQVDKGTGTVVTSLPLGGLPPTPTYGSYAYAFATWGGSFYIFYFVEGTDASSNVWKLETDGSLVKYIPNVGSVIVGAGVSTCAPVEPPK